MQINPIEVIEKGVVTPSEFTKVQQVGIDCSLKDTIHLENLQSVNVLFNETINLPLEMFALFYVRSSYSRKGIFISGGVYDPGYHGSIGCTIYNLSGSPIDINMGERIGQLICFEAKAAGPYNGQWQGK